jgi:hypothetical protein
MRKIYMLLCAVVFFVTGSVAQNITVSGAVVGNGTYATLADAFTAINGGAQTAAAINISIVNNTTEPAAGASLNAGTWTSITIAPSGGPWTVSGAITAGNPLINLNGADNVTINGSLKNLTLSNTTAATTSGTSTIKFIGDATNNTITDCFILGAFTSTTAGTNGGNIFFSTGTTTGNDGNTISNNNIGPVTAGGAISRGIYSNGSTTLATFNSGVTITNNNIFDYAFSGTTGISRGIDVAGGNTSWTITNNKLFLTIAKNLTAGQIHAGIYIINTTTGSDGFLINNNTIGYNGANAAGTYSVGATPATTQFYAIYLSPATTATACQVNNNIISDITHSSTYTTTTTPTSNFGGITVLANAGVSINGNTIRNISNPSTASAGSHLNCIYLAGISTGTQTINGNTILNITRSNTAGAGEIRGIRIESPTTVTANNNTIRLLTHNGTGNTGSVWGIYDVSSAINVTYDNNVIDSLTNNVSSAGSGTISGIRTFGSSGNKVYSNNTISNLNGINASTVNGISVSASSTPNPMTITGNKVFAITGGAAAVNGILHSTSSSVVNIQKNNVYNLASSASSTNLNGISCTNGITVNIVNNFVSDLKAPNDVSNIAIVGVSVTGGTTANVLHNTVFLGSAGTLTGGATFGGAGILLNTTPSTTNIQNNIINVKATKTGDAYFASIKFSSLGTAASAPAGFTPKNNIYNAPNVYGEGSILSTATDVFGANGGSLAFFNDVNTANGLTCNVYKQLFTTDKDSYIEDNLSATTPNGAFVPSGDSYANNSNVATTPAVADDYAGTARPAAPGADRGALEFAGTSPAACDGTTTAGTASTTTPSVCLNTSASLSATGFTTGKTGLSYQWASSTNSGGPYNDIVGATNPTYTSATLTAPIFYVFKVICGSCGTGTTYTSNEVAIAINALPTVTVSPSTGTYCSPGGIAVALTGSGATTYAWSPAAGLSATSGTSVNATPTANTTYTVTGTDANGCKNTATSLITVNQTPTFTSVTATPSVICSGANSQLLASVPVVTPIKITEVCLNRGGTGGGIYPAYAPGADLVEVSNISSSPVDISGWSLADFASNTGTATHTGFVFPAGTIIPANGVAIVCMGTGVDDIPNRYYNTGGTSDNWLSSGLVGFVLKNGSTIVDAVGCGSGYIFAAGTGIISTDWSGFAPSGSGLAGTTRTAAIDNNTGADWIAASATSVQTIGVYNGGFFGPLGTVTYNWTPTTFIPAGQETIANPLATAVTTTTTYNVTATANGCTSAPSPVTVTVSTGAAITQEPVSVASCVGTKAFFKVKATGPTLTYAWSKNGTPLSNGGTLGGATTDSLFIDGVIAGDAGIYTCLVTSICGSPVTSNNTISLTVNAKPTISIVSATGSNTACGSLVINSTTNAAATIGYQWINGTAAISGATNATYTAIASGNYRLRVQDGVTGCFDTTATIVITINPNPTGVTAAANLATLCTGNALNLTSSYLPTGMNNYTPTRTTGTSYTSIIPATTITTWRNALSTDDNLSDNQPVGFNFVYNGVAYSTFRVSTNGFVTFDNASTATGGGLGNPYSYTNSFTTAATGLMVAPNWDDLQTAGNLGTLADLNSSINYTTSGAAGSRVTTVEWKNMQDFSSTSTASYNFQVKLYEADNHIEFVYGTMTQSAATVSYSLGLSAATVSASPTAAELLSQTTVNTGTFGFTNTTALTPVPATNTTISFNLPVATYSWTGPAGFTSAVQNPTISAVSTSGVYNVTVTNPSTTCFTTASTATVTATGVIASTPISLTADANTYALSGVTPYMANCRIIAEITPGTVAGNVLAKTTIVPAGVNGVEPFGPRVTDLEPTIDGTGAVKLYFKQSEFDAYNTYLVGPPVVGYTSAPTSISDVANAANVRVRQFHGPNATFVTNTGTDLLVPTSTVYDAAGDNGAGWWVVTVNAPSFSSFYQTTTPIVTPVTLSTIRGELTGATNTVYWSTATESNSNKFVVQRSTNGSSFTTIGEVATKAVNGNSNSMLNYNFIDVNPVQGKAFYKLQIVDNSNTIKYSPIVTLRRGAGKLEIVDVRPNPTTGTVYFYVLSTSNSVTVAITDLTGKIVINKGLVQSNNFSVDMSGLANGMYILAATDTRTGEKSVFKVNKN